MVTVVPASDGRWDALLSPVPHDIFQTAGFHRFASTIEHGEPWLAVVGDAERGVAWPYLLRELTGVEGLAGTGARDIGSLHGYTGPVAWGVCAGDPWLETAWGQIRAVWLDQGAVSAFVRFHPLLPGGGLAAGLGELETGSRLSLGVDDLDRLQRGRRDGHGALRAGHASGGRAGAPGRIGDDG